MTKTKLYKFTNTSLTLGLGLLLFYFLFESLDLKDTPISLRDLEFDLVSVICIAFVMLLMIANWTVEAFKWNSLIKSVYHLSDRELISSIALGLCANILAPNRTGELAGRLKHIPSTKRRSALYLNLFSASSQLLITFVLGIIALIALLPKLAFLNAFWNAIIYLICIALVIASLTIFFRSQLLKVILLKKLRKVDQTVEPVQIDHQSRLKVLSLSMLRYVIFVVQFYLILIAIHARIEFVDATIILSVTFFVNSFIPSNWLTEVVTKGSVIYFVSGLLGYDPLLAVTASFGLWFINLLIPSSLSLYFLKDINWMRLIRS